MCLQSNVAAWAEIGAPRMVIDWLTHGVRLPFSHEPPYDISHGGSKPLNESQKWFVDTEIEHLLAENIIERCEFPHVVSPINVVPKRQK